MCKSLFSEMFGFETYISCNDFGVNGFAEVDSSDKKVVHRWTWWKLIDFMCVDFTLSCFGKSMHGMEEAGTLGARLGFDIL